MTITGRGEVHSLEQEETEAPKRIPWRQHRAWLDHNWEAGMHVSIVCRTGGGKSHLYTRGLLPLWGGYRGLIFDNKGDDETLRGYGEIVHSFPAAETGDGEVAGGRLYRLIVPEFEFNAGRRDTDGLKKARSVAGSALHTAYLQGQWLLIIDETKPFTNTVSEFGLGLRGVLENIWERGRSRGVTLIACTQQPVWMPSSFYSQPTLVYLGQDVELDNSHVRDIGGHRDQVRRGLLQLRRHEFLCISRNPRGMWIVKVDS